MARQDPVNGLIVLDKRFVDTTYLKAVGAGATDSSYTEGGAQPGTVEAVATQKLVPLVSGAQSVDLDLYVNGGGSTEASMSYSIDGGTNWRGYNKGFITRYGAGSTSGIEKFQIQTIPETQEILWSWVVTSSGNGRVAIYNPLTSAISGTVTVASGAADIGISIVRLSESVYLAFYADSSDGMLNMSVSSDQGATWTTSRQNILDIGTSATEIFATKIGECIILLVEDNVARTIVQYASSDYGNSFTEIDTVATAVNGRAIEKNGKAYVGYILDGAPDLVYIGSIGNAYTSINDLTVEAVASGVPAGVVEAFDFDLVADELWVYLQQNDNAYIGRWDTVSEVLETPFYAAFNTNDTVTGLSHGGIAFAYGMAVVIANANSTVGTYDTYAHFVHVSDFSSIEVTPSYLANYPKVYDWLAFEQPSNLPNWSLTGTGSPTFAAGTMTITTAASSHYYTYAFGATKAKIGVNYVMSVTSGGSTAGDDVAVNLVFINNAATNTYIASIRHTTTQIALNDSYGATTTTTNLDCTVTREYLFWVSSNTHVSLATKLPTERNWTIVFNDVAITGNAGTTNATVKFGTIPASTNTAVWSRLSVFDTPTVQTSKANFVGYPFTSNPTAIPGLGTDATPDPGFLRVVGGPSFTSQQYSVPVAHQYGIEKCLPKSTPTPSKEWRSTSTAEQKLVFDMGAASFLGNGAGLYIQDANFKTAYLEYYDGAAWQSVGTWNAAYGFGSVAYTSTGDTLYPSAGTAGSRFIGGHELKGGWVDLGGGNEYKILGNSGGFWSNSANTKPYIRVDGTIGAGSGTCDICWPTALLLIYSTAAITPRYWRVRIPTQSCADSYFKASVIAVGRIRPFGQAWGWGWSSTTTPNFDSHTDLAGSETRIELGDPKRSWSFAFTDGLDTTDLRSVAASDYVAVSGGASLGTVNDVAWALKGVMTDTESWTIPVIACSKLGGTTGSPGVTLTDPTLFLYGYLSGSISTQYAAGVDGVSEVQRLETIIVDEVV